MKKIMALLLAALMLGSALVACSDAPAETTDTTAAVGETTPEVTTEPEETKIPSGLPETMDLKGQKFIFYGKTEIGVYAEEETGETVNDLVYDRNRRLQEQYNFTVYQEILKNQTNPTKDIMASVQAGDDAYQVLIDGPGNSLKNYVTNMLLVDMTTMKYQDFDQPWWYQELNKSVSLANKLYMTAGSFSLSTRQWMYMIFANKDLMKANGLNMADYYQMVYDGKWTLDEFIKVTKVGAADLNGDGVRDNNDRWGHTGEDYAGYVLAVGGGYMITQKDENDRPIISAATEEGIALWDKLVNNIFADSNNYLCIRNIKNVSSIWSEQTRMVRNNQILTYISTLGNAHREYEIDYGILPIPKATADQENYYHTGSGYNTPMMGVPITAKNLDDISFILEAMAYDSYYNVLDEFYENYMETKLARDRESVDMLRIIHDSIVLDAGSCYGWGGYLNEIYKVVNQGKNTLVTFDASKKAAAQKTIDDLIEKVKQGNEG